MPIYIHLMWTLHITLPEIQVLNKPQKVDILEGSLKLITGEYPTTSAVEIKITTVLEMDRGNYYFVRKYQS